MSAVSPIAPEFVHCTKLIAPAESSEAALVVMRVPTCPCRACLIDESSGEPRRLHLARRIPAAGPTPPRMSDQTTLGQGYAHRRSGRARTQFAHGAKHQAPRIDARGSRPRVGRMDIVLERRQLNPTDDARDIDRILNEAIQPARHQLGNFERLVPRDSAFAFMCSIRSSLARRRASRSASCAATGGYTRASSAANWSRSALASSYAARRRSSCSADCRSVHAAQFCFAYVSAPTGSAP